MSNYANDVAKTTEANEWMMSLSQKAYKQRTLIAVFAVLLHIFSAFIQEYFLYSI